MHPETAAGASVPAFLAKLWRLVEDPETNHLIYWNSDGRSFIIQNQAQFARDLLPLNYKHNNMASFIRQLNMYGFHKITSLDNGGLKFDRDEMEFTHPCFQRGHPFMLENIKRKIAHARGGGAAEDKIVATTQSMVKPESLNRVLNEVKMMRGKQEVLDNRFSEMKQENEALWREVVMLRQKHMKQQQIVNKLIQFLVTIVQPSGRGNMGMKRRLPLMLNEAPSSSKARKKSSNMEIHSLGGDSDYEDDEDEFINVLGGNGGQPSIMFKRKVIEPSSSSRGIISEIPNTPSSTRSHHDDLDDIDEIIEEEAPEEEVKKIFDELNEATGEKPTPQNGQNVPKTAASAVASSSSSSAAVAQDNDADALENFIQFNNPPTGRDQQQQAAVVNTNTNQNNNTGSWYANKEGFISAEMPNELFDEQSQSSSTGPMHNSNVNPTLSEDLATKIAQEVAGGDGSGQKKAKKFTGPQLQLARLPSNNGDVFSLNTPEDFTAHLENVQTDLNALKGLLNSDQYAYDPLHLSGMFEDIPYQLSSDCLGMPNEGNSSKEDNEKQMLEYNPPQLDFSELLDGALDDSSLGAGRSYMTSPNLDNSGSLNTPQPQ